MKHKSKRKFKKQTEIFNLKEVLNNANNESRILISKNTELLRFFKDTKKLINEKIKELSKIPKNGKSINNIDQQIKQQICIQLNEIIKKYKEGKIITSVNNKKEEYKKQIREKENNLNIMLQKLKYKKLQKQKYLLKQIIKEKKNIYDILKDLFEYNKDISNIYRQKNMYFLNNIYYFNNKYLNINLQKKKNKKIPKFFEKKRQNIIGIEIQLMNQLKERKKKYFKKFNDYMNDKALMFEIPNNRCQERYNIEIELRSDYSYSSESEHGVDTDDIDEKDADLANNRMSFTEKNNNKEKNDVNKKNTIKQISLSSSEKDTNDQEKEIKNNNNLILLNKLIEIKERYNKLIYEKYELDYQKKKREKKITQMKSKIDTNSYFSSLLSFKNNHKDDNNKKYKNSNFFNVL